MKLEEVKKPILYTSKEVCDFMQIPYINLYRLVKNGKLKVVNIATGGSKEVWRFTGDAVQEYYDNLPNSTKRLEDINK